MPEAIRISRVSKSFMGTSIFRDVSVEIPLGGSVALIGPSGSGKTTLLNLLARFEPCDSGTIEIGSAPFMPRIGYVFQRFNLLVDLTACQNLMVAERIAGRRGAEIKDHAIKMLLSLGIEEEKAVLTPAGRLSVGEMQRVAIARALVVEPKLLLADEPTASVDAEAKRIVLDALFEACRGTGVTAIVATHDNAVSSRCEHVFRVGGHSVQAERCAPA